MNKVLMMLAVALSTASVFAMSLEEAKGKIDKVIETPQKMTDTMKELSSEDQKAFVAEVNKAIAELPGSVEEKSAAALNVARAALKGAKGSVSDLLAVIYATAPLESLVVINEVFAKDVLNRSADPSKTYTDEAFVKIAKTFVEKVLAQVAGADDAEVRAGFAALTMIRASNGSPSDLADTLAAMLGKSADVAKNEWFTAALSDKHDYDPMLAATLVTKVPEITVTLMVAGPQRCQLLLAAMDTGDDGFTTSVSDGFGDISLVQTTDQGLHTLPRTTDTTKPWNPAYNRGQPVVPEPEPGPRPYDEANW